MRFIGTKIITAEAMTRDAYNRFRGWELPADEDGEDRGYLVEYQDGGKPNVQGRAGYVSWSPKEQFDAAYRPCAAMTFGLAVEALKRGAKVARAGWNGKGMGLKAPDTKACYGCAYCHDVLDGRRLRPPGMTLEAIEGLFDRAVKLTHARLREKGLM